MTPISENNQNLCCKSVQGTTQLVQGILYMFFNHLVAGQCKSCIKKCIKIDLCGAFQDFQSSVLAEVSYCAGFHIVRFGNCNTKVVPHIFCSKNVLFCNYLRNDSK